MPVSFEKRNNCKFEDYIVDLSNLIKIIMKVLNGKVQKKFSIYSFFWERKIHNILSRTLWIENKNYY